jgi:nucleotide-binding universal stress UspA family protein
VALACSVVRKARDSKVYALYVIEVQRQLPLDADLPAENERGENALQHAEQIASKYDLTIETDLLQAREVGPAIVDEAVERGVDLIVLGVDYKRKFGEFTLGKTAPYVLKNAPCRVWVCREPTASVDEG